MEFIDTHAHLYTDEFEGDQTQVMQRAREAGVKKVVLPAIDSKSHQAMLKMVEQYPGELFPLMGLHPTSVKDDYQKELAVVEKYLSESSLFYGIGEIGIDLYWDKTHYKEQSDAFKIQVGWAKQLKQPVVIHTRDSFAETFNLLEPMVEDGFTGIFHCFGGSVEEAKKAIALGFYLGIGGVLTFKNSKLNEVLKQVDINHLVLETDSPYLAPTPFRGKRNESSYLIQVADKLAEVYQISVEEVARITTANATKVFQWKKG
ncbi:MAG: hydrolase TatD [Bacteroidetes bacterium HGW-Bacteroidetes-4]|nr:MAG: hydrolase TatD [Bacteroidetes bacterium HGW-Bacteroidetes-4]